MDEYRYEPRPEETGVGEYCAPGDTGVKRWLLLFDDADMPRPVFDDDAEARSAFARAEARGWNCHLFEHCRRVSPNTQ